MSMEDKQGVKAQGTQVQGDKAEGLEAGGVGAADYSALLDEQIKALAARRQALDDEDDMKRARRERNENRRRVAAAIVDGLTSLANVGGAYYGATPIQINPNATHLASVNRDIQQLAAQRQQIRDMRTKIDNQLTELLVKRTELAQDYRKTRNEDARKDAELKLKQNAEQREADLHPMAVDQAKLNNQLAQKNLDWIDKDKDSEIKSRNANTNLVKARQNQINRGTMTVEYDGSGNKKKC